jgi:hypothetical protein
VKWVPFKKIEKEIMKPKMAFHYNTNMGGADLTDQMLQPCVLECKKGNKWYIKCFKRLLNVAVHNTKVLFRLTYGSKKVDHLSFRMTPTKSLTVTRACSTTFCTRFLLLVKRSNHRNGVSRILGKRSKKNPYTGAQTVKQASASRSTPQNNI